MGGREIQCSVFNLECSVSWIHFHFKYLPRLYPSWSMGRFRVVSVMGKTPTWPRYRGGIAVSRCLVNRSSLLRTIWYFWEMLGLESYLDGQLLQVREITWTITALSTKRPAFFSINQRYGPWAEHQTSENQLFPPIKGVSDPFSGPVTIYCKDRRR